MRRQVNGILLLDKPIDITSNSALQRIKHLFNAKKAGHTGSLDPIATGMLPICFGEATKFSQFLLESNKTYFVVAKLGVETTTGDTEGDVVDTKPIEHITREKLQNVLNEFLGVSSQIPPMYSALKHHGRPLYELAREGICVKRNPREITIFSIELLNFSNDNFSFKVHCSKGTYIRTLVEDICKRLICCGHVIKLHRQLVSPYYSAKMYKMDELEKIMGENGVDGLANCLLPLESSVGGLPAVKLTTSSVFYLKLGQPVRSTLDFEPQYVRLLDEDGKFFGVGEITVDGKIKPHRLTT